MGVLKLGFLANFLSHPVIAGFITASGILIATSQLGHVLGIGAGGHTLPQMIASLVRGLPQVNPVTACIGVAATAFLFWVRRGLRPLLRRMGLGARAADIATKAGPVLAVVVSTLAVRWLGLDQMGVRIVGVTAAGLPPPDDAAAVGRSDRHAAGSAALISRSSGSWTGVGRADRWAAKRRQRIDPDQELIGLGAANLGAAFTGGMPVTGGFARSVVNFDAGAATAAARGPLPRWAWRSPPSR